MVIPIGFEPMTYRLEICCSIQLSYGTSPIAMVDLMPQRCEIPVKI